MTRLIEQCGCLAVFLIVWPTLSGIAAHLPGKQIDRLSRPFAITVDVAGTIVFVAAGVVIGSHCPGDVLGGALVGATAAVLVLTWLRPIPAAAARLTDQAMQRLRLLPRAQ